MVKLLVGSIRGIDEHRFWENEVSEIVRTSTVCYTSGSNMLAIRRTIGFVAQVSWKYQLECVRDNQPKNIQRMTCLFVAAIARDVTDGY